MHLYKMSLWQGASGIWYCEDTDLKNVRWWYACRMLDMTPAEYVEMLATKYNAVIEPYYAPTKFLGFHWKKENYNDALKFKTFINKEAKKRGAYF